MAVSTKPEVLLAVGGTLILVPDVTLVRQVASRWNTTVEGAIEVEKDLQFDKALYDELRTRRDFGFEQVGVVLPHREGHNINESATLRHRFDFSHEATGRGSAERVAVWAYSRHKMRQKV